MHKKLLLLKSQVVSDEYNVLTASNRSQSVFIEFLISKLFWNDSPKAGKCTLSKGDFV